MKHTEIAVFSKILKPDNTLHEAIASVLQQSFLDFRYYILVGDRTKDIIQEYANKDERIMILEATDKQDDFHNHYREIAENSKYVFCLDGDDWIEKDCLEKLYYLAENNQLDITVCGNNFCDEHDGKIVGTRLLDEDMLFSVQEALACLPMLYQFFRVFWGRLIRSSLLLSQEELITGIHLGGYGGDTLKNFQLLQSASKIGIAKGCLYNYRMNSTSASAQLLKGRLDSDETLFAYVKDVLVKFGQATDSNIGFLLEVYKNAVDDTLKLLIRTDISEEERCKGIKTVLNKPLTRLILLREKEGRRFGKNNSASDEISIDFAEIIFSENVDGIEKESVWEEYTGFFSFLFPCYHAMPVSVFRMIAKRKRLLLQLMKQNETGIVRGFLVEWKSFAEEEKALLHEWLLKITKEPENCLAISCKKILDKYLYIAALIVEKRYDEARPALENLIVDREATSVDMDFINVYISLAAISEDVQSFIDGKVYKMKCHYERKEDALAKKEYEDLLEMGVNKEELTKIINPVG